MDWTLAQMFSPAAYILSNEVEEFHKILSNRSSIKLLTNQKDITSVL